MGKIRTEELKNGNIGLEITYGGLDSPYGGVDSSAPPAYIDPRCFTDSDGFLIVNNRLCAVAFERVSTPVLWGGDVNVKLLKFGTFYNSIYGLRNYALGYKAEAIVGPPSGVNYTFYMTSWNPQNLADFDTDTLPYTLYDADGIATAASISLGLISTNTAAPATGSGATGNITAVNGFGEITAMTVAGGINYGVDDVVQVLGDTSGASDAWIKVTTIGGGGSITGFTIFSSGLGYVVETWTAGSDEAASGVKLRVISTSGTNDYNVKSWVSGYTKQQVVAALVNEFTLSPNPDVNAAASADGFSLILTAKIPGVGGNAFTVQDLSTNHDPTKPPPLFFPCRQVTNFQGGTDAGSFQALRSFLTPISSATVGGTVYFAGIGPLILKYSGPNSLAVSTSENGAGVIRKFAGSLIALRDIPQLGTLLQNQDMIFAWTANGKLDIWSPVDTDGNVTGAGFEQIADIGDYLTGLIVSGGTAFIIRAQGISYATSTGNATLPFAIGHIGLGDQGEGSQTEALICQYDQVGAFVGNTDIFQVAGSISSIGQKIKTALFTALQSAAQFLDSNACAVYIGGESTSLVAFLLDSTIYLFNTSNGTWMTSTIPTAPTKQELLLGTLSGENTMASGDGFQQTSMSFAAQAIGALPVFYALTETVRDTNSLSAAPDLTFVAEELLFGRDVTIDALLVSLSLGLTQDLLLDFYISGVFFSTLTLSAVSYPTLTDTPIEFQVFPQPVSLNSSGVFTVHSPQLEIRIRNFSAGLDIFRGVKFTMFGSFDPKQRPV